jgi:hypothetical protein
VEEERRESTLEPVTLFRRVERRKETLFGF